MIHAPHVVSPAENPPNIVAGTTLTGQAGLADELAPVPVAGMVSVSYNAV